MCKNLLNSSFELGSKSKNWAQLPEFIKNFISAIHSQSFFDWKEVALEIYNWQRVSNPIYQSFLKYLNKNHELTDIEQIPFLPIQFFKSQDVKSGDFIPELIFKSSGTTQQQRSKHLVSDSLWYQTVSSTIFQKQFGPLKDSVVIALLPNYLAAGDSSMVYMANHFMQESAHSLNGFYLEDYNSLKDKLKDAIKLNEKIIFIGVPYALIDFSAHFTFDNYNQLILIETGGMKGKRQEMSKEKLHRILKNNFNINTLYSEYGMTELLSQCYTTGKLSFQESSTMKIKITEINDPFTKQKPRKTGQVNVIDLANIFSCSFIQTGDLGIYDEHNQFEIIGRMNNAEIRGCNLLYENIKG